MPWQNKIIRRATSLSNKGILEIIFMLLVSTPLYCSLYVQSNARFQIVAKWKLPKMPLSSQLLVNGVRLANLHLCMDNHDWRQLQQHLIDLNYGLLIDTLTGNRDNILLSWPKRTISVTMIVDSLFPIQIISSKSGGLCQYSSIVKEPSLESNT